MRSVLEEACLPWVSVAAAEEPAATGAVLGWAWAYHPCSALEFQVLASWGERHQRHGAFGRIAAVAAAGVRVATS